MKLGKKTTQKQKTNASSFATGFLIVNVSLRLSTQIKGQVDRFESEQEEQ